MIYLLSAAGVLTWLLILSLCRMGYYAKHKEKEELELLKQLFSKETT